MVVPAFAQAVMNNAAATKTAREDALGPLTGPTDYVKARIEDRVKVFGALTERPIEVRYAMGAGHTDAKSYISVDLTDPEAFLVSEHELSHIVFGTDVDLARSFSQQRAADLLRGAGILDPQMLTTMRPRLEGVIFKLWNVLEDHRVWWLWLQLYYGGGTLLEERWEGISQYKLRDPARTNLLAFAACMASKVPVSDPDPKIAKCEIPIRRAMNLVEGVDNIACMAIMGRLIDDIGNALLEPPDPPNPPPPGPPKPNKQRPPPPKTETEEGDAGEGEENSEGEEDAQASDDTNEAPPRGTTRPPRIKSKPRADPRQEQTKKNQEELNEKLRQILAIATQPAPDTDGIGAGHKEANMSPRPGDMLSLKRALQAARTDAVDDDGEPIFTKLMEGGANKMTQRLEEAQALAQMPKISEAEHEASGAAAAFVQCGIPRVVVSPSKPLPRFSSRGAGLKGHFTRIKQEKRRRHREDGEEIDIDRYIEAMATGQFDGARLFTTTVQEKGHQLLVLGDVSGSMWGRGLEMLDQALADLAFAAEPDVKITQWGFSDSVFTFSRIGSFQNALGVCYGGTSLVQALDVAGEWAKEVPRRRGVLLITDGEPTSLRARNTTGDRYQDMRAVLHEMERAGIPVSILAYGPHSHLFDASFGQGRYGHVIDLGSLGPALLSAGRVLVEAFLRRK